MKNTTKALFDDDPYQQTLKATVMEVKEDLIRLDATIFYPVGGGQPADTGTFNLADGTALEVINTFRDEACKDIIWHQVAGAIGRAEQGSLITGKINWERRYKHMKMHTCLHLLTSLVDAPVTGCDISEFKGRLDFDLPNPDSVSKADITTKINDLIKMNLLVQSKVCSPEELSMGSVFQQVSGMAHTAISGAVRIVEIHNQDVQPCSGTHVKSTQEIQAVECTKIKKVSKTNRRIYIEFSGPTRKAMEMVSAQVALPSSKVPK